LIKNYGGAWIVIAINVCMTFFFVASIYSSNVLLAWSDKSPEVQFEKFDRFTIIAFSTGAATGIFVFFRALILVLGAYRSSRILQREMLNKVLSAPINLYYDVTPIGQILNRFSKDLDVLDS